MRKDDWYPALPPGWLRKQIEKSIESLNSLPENVREALKRPIKNS